MIRTKIIFSVVIVTFCLYGSSKPQYLLNSNPFRKVTRQDLNSIQGTYSFTDPNGVRRTVSYVGDGVNGFKIVEKQETTTSQPHIDVPQNDNDNGTLPNPSATLSPENNNKASEEQRNNSNIQYIPVPVYFPPQNSPYYLNQYPYPYRYSPFG